MMMKGQGSDGGALATLRQRYVSKMWRHDVRPPSDSGSKKPAAVLRHGLLKILAMTPLCR